MIVNRRFATHSFVIIGLFIALIAALFGSSFSSGHVARAAGNTWIVSSTADDSGSNCSAITYTGTNCELRDAIAQAAAGDTITFSVTGIITLNSTYGTLTLSKNVTITGPGASNLAIDGGHVPSGSTSGVGVITVNNAVTATITGLTIQHGYTTWYGGGIYNHGILTVSNMTFYGNTAYYGGGICNDYPGTLIVNTSTFNDNSATYGGGACNDHATMTVSNSTFFNNTAQSGGGITNNGTLTVSNSTVSGNSVQTTGSAQNLGGGIDDFSGTLALLSVIIANNSVNGAFGYGPDVYYKAGTIVSLGHNIIGDGTASGLTATGTDQIGTSANPVDPHLATLADNGGPTQTMALLTGSPAIGVGDCNGNASATPSAPAVSTDQRGIARGNPCDIGAYEGSINSTSTSTATSTSTFTNTPTLTSSSTPTNTPTATSTPTATATTSPAATFTVNSLIDDQTAGTGACVQPGTTCLRNAIASALAISRTTNTTINFSLSGTITVKSPLEISNSSNNPIIIDGSGQSITLDGGSASQILVTDAGSMVTLNALTLTHGYSSGYGGAVFNDGGTLTIINSTIANNTAVKSGGIENHSGTLTIRNSTITGNTSTDSIGGIGNLGTATISGSTISGNNGGTFGGGVYNDGTITISNSTIANNNAVSDGGIANYNYGLLTLANSTVSGNTTLVSAGGVANYGTANLLSAIIAGNTAFGSPSDVSGTFVSGGYNVIGNTTGGSGFIGSDQQNSDPKLNALANNSGSTQTFALQPGSPAIGKGYCGGNASISPIAPAVTTDQRGVARNSPCDAGSFEGGISATPTPTPTATSTPVPAKIDTIGVYRGGKFYLRLHNSTGFADLTAAFTAGAHPYPVVGDWTGSGFDSIGVFDQATANFYLRNTISAGSADATFTLGNPNDAPLVGRWQISATYAGVGVYRPGNGTLYLKNALSTGFADDAMVMGLPGDEGIAGDWTGKRFDSPGVFRPGNSTFYLSNQVTNGPVFADLTATYGSATDLPIAGDWIAQGHDGISMFRPTNGNVYLKNALTNGFADNSFFYGAAGDQPIAGHWQAVYPPIASVVAPVLIPRTPIAQPGSESASVPGDHQIGG